MASRRFGLSVSMSMLEIPLPEEDDMSDDEFDGYVDPDEAPFDSEVGYDGEESEADDDVPSIPDFRQPTGPSLDMSNKTPLDFSSWWWQKTCWTGLLNKQISTLNSLWMPPPSPHTRACTWLEQRGPHSRRAKEVSGNDHHHGPGKLSSHRGLLGYVLAVLNYHFLKGIYIPILPCTYILLCTHADLHVQCHVYNINE